MKHLLRAAALAALLTGCNSATTVISDIQQAAVTVCAFEPTAASIAAIVAASGSGASTTAGIAAIAANICKVVTAMPAAEAETAAQWVYPGTAVPIQGAFVKKGTRV
jgi:hypothetical protein